MFLPVSIGRTDGLPGRLFDRLLPPLFGADGMSSSPIMNLTGASMDGLSMIDEGILMLIMGDLGLESTGMSCGGCDNAGLNVDVECWGIVVCDEGLGVG